MLTVKNYLLFIITLFNLSMTISVFLLFIFYFDLIPDYKLKLAMETTFKQD